MKPLRFASISLGWQECGAWRMQERAREFLYAHPDVHVVRVTEGDSVFWLQFVRRDLLDPARSDNSPVVCYSLSEALFSSTPSENFRKVQELVCGRGFEYVPYAIGGGGWLGVYKPVGFDKQQSA